MDLGRAPFKIVKMIGSGTSSTVYEAIHLDRNESVALKVFEQSLLQDSNFLDRIGREVETLKSLSHPNVAKLFKFWKNESACFLELELVDGQTLTNWMMSFECVLLEPRLWVLTQIARAVGPLHEQGILHRDLKPDNVLVANTGDVKLTDFGLARIPDTRRTLSQTGVLIGSLAYMAPELLRGEKATRASDLFSFGVIGYEILAGRHPFSNETPQSTISAILEKRIIPLSQVNPRVPLKLSQMIMCCLETEASLRPNSIWDIEAQLMNYFVDTGLLEFSKAAINSFASQETESLHRALCLKHLHLKSRLEFALAKKDNDRAELVSDLNEFASLFPNDPALTDYFKAFKPEQSKSMRRFALFTLGLFAVALVVLILGSIFIYKKSSVSSPIESRPIASASVAQIASSALIPAQVLTPAKATVEALARVAPASRGRLRVLVDDDVRVYLDGRQLKLSELNGLKLKAGSYQLLMEKDGFRSIEETIRVIAGRTLTINTQGNTQDNSQGNTMSDMSDTMSGGSR